MMRLPADLLVDQAQALQNGYGAALHVKRVHVKAMHVARLQDAFAHGSALVDAKFLRQTTDGVSSIARKVRKLLMTALLCLPAAQGVSSHLDSLVIVLDSLQSLKDLGRNARFAEARHALEPAVGHDRHDTCMQSVSK